MSLPQPPERRKAIPKRVRFEVLKRDDHACRYCGGRAPDVVLTVDHVVPVVLGGTNDPGNLVAACADCNSGKTSTSPESGTVTQVADDAVRWSSAMKEASRRMLADLDADTLYAHELNEAWIRWTCGPKGAKKEVPRPTGWWNSATAWRVAGLPAPLMVDAVQRAMGNDRLRPDDVWKYFCGIAWNRVTELQEHAKEAFSAMPQGDDMTRAVAIVRKAFPWAEEVTVDEERLRTAWYVTQPSRALAHLQLRALSRVVDGPTDWNENAALAELAAG